MSSLPSKKIVLIIDDEEELCMLMELVLHRENFFAQSIHNLTEALSMVEKLRPDYIFLDNHLPDGRGLDFIKRIILVNPKVKIIMMTAFNDQHINEKAIGEGASYFLHKPFNRNNIENIINNL